MNKNELSRPELIEYYLGKDHLKDIFFKPEFPDAYQDIKVTKLGEEEYRNVTRRISVWFPDVDFTFNNLGYRSNFDYILDELKTKNNIVLCLGCTDTFGMNVHADKMWTKHLTDACPDKTVLNLGIIGASGDTIFRILTKITRVLPTQITDVCILWPHTSRREFVSKTFTTIMTGHDPDYIPYEDYWSFIDWKSDSYNFHKNQHSCRALCEAHSVKFHDLYINRFDKKVPFDYAGKYYALGENSHLAVGKYFSKLVKGEPSLFNTMKK